MQVASIIVVEFDFEKRVEREITIEQARQSCDSGLSCWIDMDVDRTEDAAASLEAMGVDPLAIEAALGDAVGGRCDVYAECLHVSVGVPRFRGDGEMTFSHVDIILGERFIITLREGDVAFIEQVRKNYHHFFAKFSQTVGFLLFDLWDRLIDTYRKALLNLEEQVEELQSGILGDVDDGIFNHVGSVTHDLLLLRKNLLADREVLEQLAMRKSEFVSDTTQPYLVNMVGTLERLGRDLATEREILAETLNLYMGVVSHKTNRVVNRLTIISVIFLPLTFLCGVYGMNFHALPEFNWAFGYLYFWGLTIVIAVGLLVLMKLKRWL